jgi:predicted Zn-dependent protease
VAEHDNENKDGLEMQNPAVAMEDKGAQEASLGPSGRLEELEAERPDSGRRTQTPLARAKTLCELRRFADAVPAVAVVISADPRDAYAWCLMAEVQLGNDRPAAALQAAHAAASLAPGRELPRRLASVSLGRLGREEEAVEAARDGTRCEPEAWEAHARLAESLSAFRNRLDEARRAAETALSLGPGHPGPHLALGTVAMAAGRRAAAASAFCAALAVDPQCLEAHHGLTGVQALGSRRERCSLWSRITARLRRDG